MMGENAGGSVFLRAIILLRIRGGRGKALLGEAPAPPAVATEMSTIALRKQKRADAAHAVRHRKLVSKCPASLRAAPGSLSSAARPHENAKHFQGTENPWFSRVFLGSTTLRPQKVLGDNVSGTSEASLPFARPKTGPQSGHFFLLVKLFLGEPQASPKKRMGGVPLPISRRVLRHRSWTGAAQDFNAALCAKADLLIVRSWLGNHSKRYLNCPRGIL